MKNTYKAVMLTSLVLAAVAGNSINVLNAQAAGNALDGVSGVDNALGANSGIDFNSSTQNSADAATDSSNPNPHDFQSFGGIDFAEDRISRPITLMEVPNFDFNMKVGATTAEMTASSGNRYLVVNDTNAGSGVHNLWEVDVKVGSFYKTSGSAQIKLSKITPIIPSINLPSTNVGKRTSYGKWSGSGYTPSKTSNALQGPPASADNSKPDGLILLAKDGSDSDPNPLQRVMYITGSGYTTNYYGLDFNDPSYAKLNDFSTTKIESLKDKYVAPITWTLQFTPTGQASK